MKKLMMGAILAMSLMMVQGASARTMVAVNTPQIGVDQDLKDAAAQKKKEAKILQNAEKAKAAVTKAENALEKAKDRLEKAKSDLSKAEKDLEKARKKAEEAQAEAQKILNVM